MPLTEREKEAREAIARLLDEYRDVLGPGCTCEHDDHQGGDDPCPFISPTVGLAGWLLVAEYSDLNPEAPVTSIRYINPTTQSPTLSLGLAQRGVERY